MVATEPPTIARISTDSSYQLILLRVYMMLMGSISVMICREGENYLVPAWPALSEYRYFCFSVLFS